MTQQRIRRRMHVQRWRDQKQQWLLDRQLLARKISKALKLAARMMPRHPRPVVQALQWQVNVFVSFKLDHGQPPCPHFLPPTAP